MSGAIPGSSKPLGVSRALLVGVAKVDGFPNLPQAHKDVVRMKEFLIRSRGYLPENIVLMMHHNSVAKKFYPSRTNMLREIDLVVQRTSQYDQIFFYYTGHGDQVTCKHNSEPDNKDEAILTYTGKRIIDNVLKARLVDPLPQGAKLFALWDCCHSQTVLDLEHYNCNELWRAPLKVLTGLARKTKSIGQGLSKRLSANILKDSSEGRSSSKDDSPRNAPLAIDSGEPSALYRVSSPDSYLPRCTFDCPITLPENRVKAYVVSLSACKDNELAYDDNVTGETVTKFFIEYLERNPEASYRELLSYIQEKVDVITRRRTQAIKPTGETTYRSHHLERLPENEVEIENWHTCEHHRSHSDDENDASTLSSQQPAYSSQYRLDMSQIVEL
ncbi:caspase domain-containing protein [Suillus paluster]|uniref:caspase domain-containing protein n=1 Tax=Suillus paluster TaxID=48578 RepID=UPI001B85B719|nr:caspase domain-containing protein [Suillus paluster]KAG1753600.1 caspase domain-containing protein [Suillus paluster]